MASQRTTVKFYGRPYDTFGCKILAEQAKALNRYPNGGI